MNLVNIGSKYAEVNCHFDVNKGALFLDYKKDFVVFDVFK